MTDVTGAVEPIGAGEEETPDRDGAFPRLADEQLARLRALGRVRRVEAGEILFAEGDQVMVSGDLAENARRSSRGTARRTG